MGRPGTGGRLVGLFCMMLLISGCALFGKGSGEPSTLKGTDSAAALTDEELRARLGGAIRLAGAYLNRHVNDAGRFDYRVFTENGEVDQEKYNVLRHAGTIYALAQTADRLDPTATSTIRNAASYLRTTFMHPVSGLDEGISAIFSMPGWERLESGRREAKLGGTALGIIALLAAEEIEPGLVKPAELQSLGRFLLFMQEPDGRFRSKYSETLGFDVDFTSLYYPGEAILALTRLYEVDGDVVWLKAAARGVAYLVQKRATMTIADLPKDHWLMIAISELLPKLAEHESSPMDPDLAYSHAVKLGLSMMKEQREIAAAAGSDLGGFSSDGRCTPTATRIEGLAALHSLASRQGDIGLMQDTAASIKPAAAFLLTCQLIEGPYAGGVPRALAKLPETPENETFNRRQSEIRIDYVQHAMSAFHGADRALAITSSR